MTGADNLRQVPRDIEVFAGELPGFDPSTAPNTPVELFTEWLPQALRAGVRGPVVREAPELCAADFLARGAGARAEARLGRQSQPLADLAERDA